MNDGEVVLATNKMIGVRSTLIKGNLTDNIQQTIFPELCAINNVELVIIIIDNLQKNHFDKFQSLVDNGLTIAMENKCYEVECILKRFKDKYPEKFI